MSCIINDRVMVRLYVNDMAWAIFEGNVVPEVGETVEISDKFYTVMERIYHYKLGEGCEKICTDVFLEPLRAGEQEAETLGAHLRNLLSPYKNLLAVIRDLVLDREWGAVIKTVNTSEENLKKLVEFSHRPEMENNVLH